MARNSSAAAYDRARSGTGLVPQAVFKTARPWQPHGGSVRFRRRSARGLVPPDAHTRRGQSGPASRSSFPIDAGGCGTPPWAPRLAHAVHSGACGGPLPRRHGGRGERLVGGKRHRRSRRPAPVVGGPLRRSSRRAQRLHGAVRTRRRRPGHRSRRTHQSQWVLYVAFHPHGCLRRHYRRLLGAVCPGTTGRQERPCLGHRPPRLRRPGQRCAQGWPGR